MVDLVTVCIPVYNGEKYLRECLLTVLNQTYKAIEIVVVDDGSTDNSVNIINEFQEIDTRIKLFINEQNLGLVKNWQKCIELAKGEWIKFIFQDDFLSSDCIEKMLHACIINEVPICICSRDFIIEDSASVFLKDFFVSNVIKLETYYPTPRKLIPSDICIIAKHNLLVNFIGEPIVLLFKKCCIEQFGNYNLDLVQLVDYEFALRICLNSESFFLPEHLVHFRVHSNSASDNQFSNNLKLVKNQFVEPLLMLHEYNFNRYFRILKRNYGALNLFKRIFFFYYNNKSSYKLPKELENYLFERYKGLQLIKFSIPAYKVFNRLKSKLL
ncbi:hypothetical protein AHMF7605_00240 [Adhaeribacter arboris]|uniref:Glycosyltransferase 2-like domain-containing protein n=1 Tax=Adhaeribacter arboris TaxID=2072846 RepID=A0A2T2Y989_9BACT|nr:glycosyltransferase [Adhaeribacter arboris]PSR52056.1 hypothetical protein AHMF7605_00240 [Adhaeribacter arboris]